ncbi:MAG: hypothetical protein R8J94_21125 [Acidimicrobiia bacterium]|nr:hypothetical protein [Acidimicrobiia bacterium]
MILDMSVVVLTSAIAIAAVWMAIGLLTRQPDRVDDLVSVGLTALAWPTVLGAILMSAVAALIIGWWFQVVGIIAIVVIKILYAVTLVAYRRSGKRRDRDVATVLMSAHSLVALAAIGLLAVT